MISEVKLCESDVNSNPLVINDLPFVEMLGRGRGLEDNNITIDDDGYSFDDICFDLSFDNIVTFLKRCIIGILFYV
jgi:hypothetical protein